MASIVDKETVENPEIIDSIFEQFDADGSGAIDAKEFQLLAYACGTVLTNNEVEEAMQVLDADGNGTIDKEEFTQWFNALADDGRNSWEHTGLRYKLLAKYYTKKAYDVGKSLTSYSDGKRHSFKYEMTVDDPNPKGEMTADFRVGAATKETLASIDQESHFTLIFDTNDKENVDRMMEVLTDFCGIANEMKETATFPSEEVNQGLKEIEFVVEKVDGGIMLKANSELSCLLLNAPMSWPVEPKDAGTVEAAVRCGFDFQSLKCGHVKKTIGETLIDGLQVSATVIADKATVSDIANSVITPGSKAELSFHSLSMLRNQSTSLNFDSSHDLMTYLSKTKVLPLGMPGKWIHSFLKLGPGCIVGDSFLYEDYGSTFPAPPNPLLTQEKVKEYYHLVRTVITGIRSVQFASKELEWVWTLSFSNFNPFCILPDVNDGNVQKYRKGGRLEKEFAELVKLGEKFNRQA